MTRSIGPSPLAIPGAPGSLIRVLALVALLATPALGQVDPHAGRRGLGSGTPAEAAAPHGAHHHHDDHSHDVGPAGASYDLRFIDAMVQHHSGALRMSELVFNIGQPGVGALARRIWRDQAEEIRAMGLWRRAWYPQAPLHPVSLPSGGDPDSLAALTRMEPEQIAAMRMMGALPSPQERVVWFLEGMLHHHGGALLMAHDALAKSTNPTIRRFARGVIVAQRAEIIELRRMLAREGLRKPAYHRYDTLFAL